MWQPEKKVGAISTFLQMLDKIGRERNRLLYFRGHSNANFQLEPSIFRNSGLIENETAMLKELILRCPNDFDGGLTTFQCLVKMQHYGLPSRLLDITSNPLVALYFACGANEKNDGDGEVIVFGYDIGAVKYFDSDTVSVVANLSQRPSTFVVPAELDVVKFNEEESIKYLLHDIGSDKPHFLPKIKREDLTRVVCVKPKLDNPRIIRQEGAFLLFGCDGSKVQPAKLEEKVVVAKLTINRNEKRNLVDQLRTLGISKATMFPEIQDVATHIQQSYFTPIIDPAKLNRVQKNVFDAMRVKGEGSVEEVAILTSLSAPTISRVISELRDMGVVEQVGSGRERRSKIVWPINIVDTAETVKGAGPLGEAHD